MTKWSVALADWGSKKLGELLDEGWEPFAVVGDAAGTTVFLRRNRTYS